MIARTMLSGKAPKHFEDIAFPVIASPKLDGIRCLLPNFDMCSVTRNFKPIPNRFVKATLDKSIPIGFDGELMVPNKNFNDVQSAIMTITGEPEFEYWVFDWVSDRLDEKFIARTTKLEEKIQDLNLPWLKYVEQIAIFSTEELENYEHLCLLKGFEGVMIRDPFSPYKEGRSTTKEGYLLKIKRFSEDEGKVVGFIELLHNNNPKKKDAFGLAERSSHQDNKVGMGTLGALVVKWRGFEFQIGTGFSAAQRRDIWDRRDSLYGTTVTFKYQKSGQKEKPRFPVFKGFRTDK